MNSGVGTDAGSGSITARFFPFLTWIGELRSRTVLRSDLVAGITVALVLIPQSMAYAKLAGLPAYYGLYAAVIPPIVGALFGSSRQLATGPTATASMMTAAALAGIVAADSPEYVGCAVLLAMMVGIFRFLMGVLRLGVLVNFLSSPVVFGFTGAVALIIVTSQLPAIFGVAAVHGQWYPREVWDTVVSAFRHSDAPTVWMAIFAFAVIVVAHRMNRRLPGVFIAMALTTLVSHYGGFDGAVVGEVPGGLPRFRLVPIDADTAARMLPSALAISLMGLSEALAIAKAMAVRTRQNIDVDQELIGQGMANIVGSFFQSFAVSGSFSRSAVNLRSGAATGFSSVVAGAVTCILLLFFTPCLRSIPQATLAVVIIVAVFGLIRIRPIVQAWRVHPHDGMAGLAAFAVTLAAAPRIEWGILTGVILSLALYLYRTMRPRVAILARHPDGILRDAATHGLGSCRHICAIRFDRSLYFANAGYFEQVLVRQIASMPELRFVIVDAQGINQIDATGVSMLRELTARLRERKIRVLFSRLKQPVMDAFRRTDLAQIVGEENMYPRTQQALEYAWKEIDDPHCDQCALRAPDRNIG